MLSSKEYENLHLLDRYELRRSTRISVNLEIRYRSKSDGMKWQKGKILDIAYNGVRFEIKRSGQWFRLYRKPVLEVGDEIELRYKLNKKTSTIHVGGQIRWKDTSPRAVIYGAELSLSDAENADNIISHFGDTISRKLDQKHATIECRAIRTAEEGRAAFRLLYQQYRKRGYCAANASEIYFAPQALESPSKIFMLKDSGQLIGTIALIADSVKGLPMDQLFKEELDGLRIKGRRIAEVGMLALDMSRHGRSMFSLGNIKKMNYLFTLYKIMFDAARADLGVSDLVINMNPKHTSLYKYLAFEAMGEVKHYPGCSKPALPMRMEVSRAIEKARLKGGGFFYNIGSDSRDRASYDWSSDEKQELLRELRCSAEENKA